MTISSSGINTHALVQLTCLASVTETLGVACTDLYIEEFESRLKMVMRPEDKMVPVSEGKYCLILNGVTEKHHVELAASKLQRVMEPPAEILGDCLFFDVHTGFVVPTNKDEPLKQILQSAETALRRAVTHKKLYAFSDQNKDDIDKPNPALLPRVERALEQGEFHLYYQVKVDAAFQHVVGAEGLVRWHDVEEKVVHAPDMFIETVENSDLILPMTETLLRMGVAKCVQWADPLSVAINLAPRVLESDRLVAVIADSLDFYGLDPHRLVLEITERGELPANLLTQLEALGELGCRISIDDFGTGQCSLSYFRDLPADQIKIDQSFISRMDTSKKDCSIVRGCIDLAHHCDIEVVAEGVEDAVCAQLLLDMGCDVLQGYHFGKPLPADEFAKAHLVGLDSDKEPDYFSDLLKD